MRKLFTLLVVFTICISGFSRILYLSPTGNDNNTGTITSPFFSLEKAWTVIVPGDTVYLRGGSYQYNNMQYLSARNGTAANLIKIWAYPGEQPNITKHSSYVFDGNNIDLIYFEGNYFHFRGIEISNFPHVNGQPAWSAFRAGFANYCIFERINYHHNAAGFSIRGNSTGNLVLNSDFHHNMDPFTVPAYDGADGLNITYNIPGNTNTIRGCRAWWNGDDGFDVWENNGYVLIENCWSFYNGYIPGTFNTAGNGSGFKLGSTSAQPTTLLRTVQNCLAFKNRSFGFVENAANCMIRLYNNTSVQHGVFGYWFGAWFPNAMTARNNISQNNPSDQFNTQSTVTNNSWQNGLIVTNADFQSTDDSQLIAARQSDGSLPVITFLHLASSSDLIDKGMNVGLGYTGSAPELGTWEYSPAGNLLPNANAGPDRNISLPTVLATLNGSGTDPDGTISSYQWTKISGPGIFNILTPLLPVTIVNSLLQGVYQFELTVTDNLGGTDKDTIIVTVNGLNQPPVANAGADKNITVPTTSITQTGSGTDPDGTIASYQWTKISGPAGLIIATPTLTTTIVNSLVHGVYKIELKVTDNAGAIGKDTMEITVNPANQVPVVSAGLDKTITLPTNSVTLTGSATDADGTISSYSWTKIAGPTAFTIVSPSQAQTVINGLVQGVYQFRLLATDNLGATGIDTMIVTVNAASNLPPVSNAGPDQTKTLPTNTATLTGSGTDPDGTITAYTWKKISGPTAGTLTTSSAATTTVTGLVQGTYKFELQVTDNIGATGKDSIQIIVKAADNVAPIANAGPNQTKTLPSNTANLAGTGTDPDGTISVYTWRKLSGSPSGGAIASTSSMNTTVSNLKKGTYKYELKVTDNSGATGRDTMQITVSTAPSNTPPIANAGPDQSVTLPMNSVTLSGSGTDPGGIIMAYNWTKISGPATGSITIPNMAITTVTGMTAGTYSFECKVFDNLGLSGKDTMLVTVNPGYSGTPYPGSAHLIPGTIQAENFDNGGQNVGRFDNTAANDGGEYRHDGVDIELSNENSPNIAYTEANEWTKYTVNVTSAGIYTMQLRVSSPYSGKSLSVEMDGITIANITVPNTGGWQSWQTVVVSNISLSAGIKVLRLVNLTGGSNINYLVFNQTGGSMIARPVDMEVVEQSGSGMQVYPNPATSTIQLRVVPPADAKTDKINIRIYDAGGLMVYRDEFQSRQMITRQLDISRFKNGAYIVEIIFGEKTRQTIRFIKL